jgi:hypothetical protein
MEKDFTPIGSRDLEVPNRCTHRVLDFLEIVLSLSVMPVVMVRISCGESGQPHNAYAHGGLEIAALEPKEKLLPRPQLLTPRHRR